jgi:hypothetical protein
VLVQVAAETVEDTEVDATAAEAVEVDVVEAVSGAEEDGRTPGFAVLAVGFESH